ncbi:MAG: hypothetical protein SH856_00305 [Flavobacteriales bacterium]|nr:hypothetical protein [Flavobacteriales bacterium]
MFKGKEGAQDFTLFTRTTENNWFLQSVEAVDSVSQEFSDWLQTKKKLKVAV